MCRKDCIYGNTNQTTIFPWFRYYDIRNQAGETIYIAKRSFRLQSYLTIFDPSNHPVALVKLQEYFSLLPVFDMYLKNQYIGSVSGKFSAFVPKYKENYLDWYIEGDYFQMDHEIKGKDGSRIATIWMENISLTKEYSVTIYNSKNLLPVVMFVFIIDMMK